MESRLQDHHPLNTENEFLGIALYPPVARIISEPALRELRHKKNPLPPPKSGPRGSERGDRLFHKGKSHLRRRNMLVMTKQFNRPYRHVIILEESCPGQQQEDPWKSKKRILEQASASETRALIFRETVISECLIFVHNYVIINSRSESSINQDVGDWRRDVEGRGGG